MSTFFPAIVTPDISTPQSIIDCLMACKQNIEILNGVQTITTNDGARISFPRLFVINKAPAQAIPGDFWFNPDTRVLSVGKTTAGSNNPNLTVAWSSVATAAVT